MSESELAVHAQHSLSVSQSMNVAVGPSLLSTCYTFQLRAATLRHSLSTEYSSSIRLAECSSSTVASKAISAPALPAAAHDDLIVCAQICLSFALSPLSYRLSDSNCMLSTSCRASLSKFPSVTVFPSCRRAANRTSPALVARVLSSLSHPHFCRSLLPVSLLPPCLPAPSAPFRQVFFMAWSAQHNPIQPVPPLSRRLSPLAAVCVTVALLAAAAAPWKRMYAAISSQPASPIAPLTAVPSSSVSPSLVACRECSSDSNAGLIDNMLRRGVLHSPAVAAAMKRVDRRHYITPASPASRQPHPSSAYVDSPQHIGTCCHSTPTAAMSFVRYSLFSHFPLSALLGFGATISAPHMHAMCAELMLDAIGGGQGDGEGVTVLDVGSGSGYLAAVLSRLIGDKGRVFGIEHIPELVDTSIRNLRADDAALLERVSIQQGDGRLGLPSAAPFDAIHVGAAAAEVPAALIEQLKEGGVLVIPVGAENDDQMLEVIEKRKGGEVRRRKVTGVRYVPLTSKHHQLER